MPSLTTNLLIVGGGINGLSLARTAAANDIDCILLDKGDFCSGTSNASSKLVHGGLRYLEHYDFKLVQEAVLERKLLLENAPNHVKEQRFFYPNCEQAQHGRFATKIGISLYEILAGASSLKPHQWVESKKLRRQEPEFLPGDQLGTYEYSDCSMDDAALALSTMVDASDLGAQFHNFQKVISIKKVDNIWQVKTRAEHPDLEDLTIEAKEISLNLGPWTDYCLKEWGFSYPQLVLLSQGTHLFVEKLPIETSFILPVPHSERYFFVLPFKEGHLIGTTETPVTLNQLHPPVCQPQENEELTSLMSLYFPNLCIKTINTITGVRPLAIESPLKQKVNPHLSIKTSRQHLFHTIKPGLHAGVGGKWTTHRIYAIEFLEKMGYQIQNNLSGRQYPIPYSQSSDEFSIEDQVQLSIEKEYCLTPLSFIRQRTGLFFTSHGGLKFYQTISEVFKSHFPKSDEEQWKTEYLAYLKRNNHRIYPKAKEIL